MNYLITGAAVLLIILGCGVVTSGAGEPNTTIGLVMFFGGFVLVVWGAIRANRNKGDAG